MRKHLIAAAVLVATVAVQPATQAAAALPCSLFPADDVWHADISGLPVNAHSAEWLASTNAASTNLHPDFGPSFGAQPVPYGIPYTVVDGSHPKVPISFQYADESDPGPYPFGSDTPIEGGQDATGDRHALMLESDTCTLYELFDAHYAAGGSTAGSGAIWNLSSDNLRPAGWTSADAAGLPILPGLLRPDEVASGTVNHAIRFTAAHTDTSYLWPARHQAGERSDPTLPPMGARFRLRSDFDMSSFRPDTQVVLRAMQKYGLILADNGSNWYFGGTAETWDINLIDDMKHIPASAFEAVDESSLMVSPDSGAVRSAGTAGTSRLAGATRYGTAAAIAAAAFPHGSGTAIIVSGTVFPDGLTGAYLAASAGGPVLLTAPDHLPTETSQALDALGATHLTILGGTDAVSDAVAQQLSARAGTTVTRVAGPTRYDTMAAADQVPPSSQIGVIGGKRTAILASGEGFADALAASGVSGLRKLPMILTPPNGLGSQAASTIQALGITQIVVMGGPAAVSAATEAAANALGASTLVRLAGSDRTDTAQLLATYAVAHFGFTPAELLLARGDGFADALAGSSAVGQGRPTLLTASSDQLGTPTGQWIAAHATASTTITALGGPAAVSDAVLAQAAANRPG